MTSQRPNVIDLFCGCGGFSLGFEKAGFNVLLGIDVWKDALCTFKHNHTDSQTMQADLSIVSPEDTLPLLHGKLRNPVALYKSDVIDALPRNGMEISFDSSKFKPEEILVWQG